MKITALIMAGGKGERMLGLEEKPLVKVGGKPMIDRVVEATKSANKIDDTIVAVSRHTPKTAERVRSLSTKVIETPGRDYHSDLRYAIRHYNLGVVLTIAADLPFIKGEFLDEIINHYEKTTKPALTVMVPARVRRELGLEPTATFKIKDRELVPVGINVVDGRRIDEVEQDQYTMIIKRPELAVNVNTLNDLKIALKMSPRLV